MKKSFPYLTLTFRGGLSCSKSCLIFLIKRNVFGDRGPETIGCYRVIVILLTFIELQMVAREKLLFSL
jgi:hypothetical protein